jgi:hypothetical protein
MTIGSECGARNIVIIYLRLASASLIPSQVSTNVDYVLPKVHPGMEARNKPAFEPRVCKTLNILRP